MSERITPEQIVDDFFHEYQEGRLDRDEMVEAIEQYARQFLAQVINEHITFNNIIFPPTPKVQGGS